jgi:tRNA A37 threonylcarbamoyladenosine biosynthesis protein TsaE
MSSDMSASEFESLIGNIFCSNGYHVDRNVNINSANVDLIVQKIGDPFSIKTFVEVTLSYVNNDKYALDNTKYSLIKQKEAYKHSKCVIVSKKGFAPPTKERATEAGVECLTYEEFRRKMLITYAYEEYVLGPNPELMGKQLACYDQNEAIQPNPVWFDLLNLESVYINPIVIDNNKEVEALEWFDDWLNLDSGWVTLIGDYGTGKTALTNMLLLRWMRRYHKNIDFPMPVRIELRHFARRMDYDGLLHHFLDNYRLRELDLRYLKYMIEEGKAILLLDGYDEMAQKMDLNDRRAMLKAFSEASKGKAKGILTSRPNYFTEEDDLNIIELLYPRISNYKLDQKLLEEEQLIDNMLDKVYVDRPKIKLIDLTQEQTKQLVERKVRHDKDAQKVILSLIDRIYGLKEAEDGKQLSGKPVVITYLIEALEGLSAEDMEDIDKIENQFDEWTVFKLILDGLIARDQSRSTGLILPGERRRLLQYLATHLSKSKHDIDETNFNDIIFKLFRSEIERYGTARRDERKSQFSSDARSGATLTRDSNNYQWRFSHNTLREYLVVESLVEMIESDDSTRDIMTPNYNDINVTDGMALFVRSRMQHIPYLDERIREYLFRKRGESELGNILTMLLPGIIDRDKEKIDDLKNTLKTLFGRTVDLSAMSFSLLNLSNQNLEDGFYRNTSWSNCSFANAKLSNSYFDDSYFINCNFLDANIENGRFVNCYFDGCKFIETKISKAIFYGSIFENNLCDDYGLLKDIDILSWLAYKGAIIDENAQVNLYQYYPQWKAIKRTIRIFLHRNQAHHRIESIIDRGLSSTDKAYAKQFLDILVKLNIAKWIMNKKIIAVKAEKKEMLENILQGKMPEEVKKLFSNR